MDEPSRDRYPPRYLADLTSLRGCPFKEKLNCLKPQPAVRIRVFSGARLYLHFLQCLETASIIDWNSTGSSDTIAVSSAQSRSPSQSRNFEKDNPLPNFLSFRASSLIKTKYKRGDEQPPCFTPERESSRSEIQPLIRTTAAVEEYSELMELQKTPSNAFLE